MRGIFYKQGSDFQRKVGFDFQRSPPLWTTIFAEGGKILRSLRPRTRPVKRRGLNFSSKGRLSNLNL